MLNNLRLSDLALFRLVAKNSSFIAAAREAKLSQTTVSKRIAVLEDELGVKLLHRTTRTVKVTDEGLKVFHWSHHILNSLEGMHDDLAITKGEPNGPIRISSSPRLGRDYVAPALSKLKKQFAGIDVWLEIMDRRVDLIQDEFHLDIRSGEPQESHLIGHNIMNSSRILCAAPSYIDKRGSPQSLNDISNHQCILYRDRNEPFGVWTLKGPRGWDTVNANGELASNDNDVVLGWAHDGHGIMLASDWLFAPSLRDRKLVRVLPSLHQPANISAVSSSRTSQSAKVRLCIEYLKEEFRIATK